MKLFQKGLVVVAAVALLVGVAAPTANALTTSQLVSLLTDLGVDTATAQLVADAVDATDGGSSSSSCSAVQTLPNMVPGDTGANVETLQQYLVDEGLLTIPAGVSMGYYGTLTASAVSALQTQNGVDAGSYAGYFGPSTKASIECGSVDMDDDSDDDSDSYMDMDAEETSLEDFDLKSEDDAEEGESKHVATIEFDVEDGDASVNRLDVTFDNSSVTGDADDEPWDVFETITLVVDGDEVAEEDIDDEDDWLDDDLSSGDSQATYRLSNLDIDIDAGDTAEIEIYLTAQDNVDDAENADWIIFIPEDGIRAVDGLRIQNYIGDDSDTVAFDLDEEGGDESIEIKSDSDDPDATTLEVDEDQESDWYDVFVFALEADENDIDIDSLELTVTTGTAHYEDVVDDIVVEIAGEEFDDVEVTDADSKTANLVFDIDKDATVDADDREDVTVMIKFNDQDGNYLVGETIQLTVTAVDGEGVDDVSDTATLSSEEHTLSLAVADVSVDGNATITRTEDDASGTISWTVDVDASDASEDITFVVAVATDVDGDTDDVKFDVLGTSPSIAVTSIQKISGDATYSGGTYTVAEGDDAKFAIDTTFTTVDSDDNGTYRVTLESFAGVTIDETSGGLTLYGVAK